MIVVEVELKSAISESRDKHQATITIANIGGSKTRGEYRYKITGKAGQMLAEGTIAGFPRKRGLAIDLLGVVLLDARGKMWSEWRW